MRGTMAVMLAVMLMVATVVPAAAAPPEPAAAPFPVVPLPAAAHQSHRAAWICLGAGAGLIGTSFVIHDRANRRYSDYLHSNDVSQLDQLYEDTRRLDRISAASLIAGEVVFAAGVYLRFLRDAPTARLSLAWEGNACVARWRF